MAAFARPTRIVRGKDVSGEWAVNEALFELEEERRLWSAYMEVVGKVDASMDIKDFLQVTYTRSAVSPFVLAVHRVEGNERLGC